MSGRDERVNSRKGCIAQRGSNWGRWTFAHLKLVVIVVRKREVGRRGELVLVLLHQLRVDLDFGRGQRGRGDELEIRVAGIDKR